MKLRVIDGRSMCWLISLWVSLTGCISTKELALYQRGETGTDTMAIAPRYIPTIKAGDVISVQVSSLSPEATTFFNPYASISAMDGARNNNQNTLPFMPGYQVDESGQIELPLIGKQPVQGLTNAQAAGQIRQKLLDYLKEPTVNVRNLNYQISITGEVARPALLSIPNEQISLPAALGMAGDITIFGQRKNVLVIREENGKRTFNQVDLTSRDIFKSPYYYLHSNDIVYVEPGKVRAASADRTNQILPLVISSLSIIALLLSRTAFR